jgi:hypothetical protein
MQNMKEKLFIEQTKFNLESIDYKLIKLPNDKSLFINANENYEIVSVNFDKITVRVTRTIDFSPEEYFSLKISVLVDFYVDERTKEGLPTEKKLEEYVKNNLSVIVNKVPVGSWISLLAGEITSNFGQTPIVLPPVFLNSDQQ